MKDMYYEFIVKQLKNYIYENFTIDIDELLKGTDATIFGGCLRDFVAGDNPKDLDIAVGTQSLKILTEKLIEKGYKDEKVNHKYVENIDNYKTPLFNVYEFTKIECRKIQLIKPLIFIDYGDYPDEQQIYNEIIRFIKNVDFNCNALLYNLIEGFGEASKNVFKNCMEKSTVMNKNGFLYNEKRAYKRSRELMNKGWEIYDCLPDNPKTKELNINKIQPFKDF
jgi:hypothetical protein